MSNPFLYESLCNIFRFFNFRCGLLLSVDRLYQPVAVILKKIFLKRLNILDHHHRDIHTVAKGIYGLSP